MVSVIKEIGIFEMYMSVNVFTINKSLKTEGKVRFCSLKKYIRHIIEYSNIIYTFKWNEISHYAQIHILFVFCFSLKCAETIFLIRNEPPKIDFFYVPTL